MVDVDVFCMREANDAAELAAARVTRKQTNKGRAVEELAKTAAAAAQRRAADAVSDDDKEAADTAGWDCCSVCSRRASRPTKVVLQKSLPRALLR